MLEQCVGALTIADLKEAAVEDCKETFWNVLVLVFDKTTDILIEMVESGQHTGL